MSQLRSLLTRGRVSTVSISAHVVIIRSSNPPLDMGVLRVELLDGKELAAADRSGKANIINAEQYLLTSPFRQIRSFRRLQPQRLQGFQESDEEENACT